MTPSAANGWTTVTCPAPSASVDVPAASCTPATASAGNNWTTTTCRTVDSPVTLESACVEGSSGAPDYIATTCTPVSGQKATYQTTTTVKVQLTSGGNLVPNVTPTVTTTTDVAQDLDGICYLAGTPNPVMPALPAKNPEHAGVPIPPWPTVGPMPPTGCSAWPCTDSQTNAGGSIDSLSDVAQYYYITDLRPAADWPDTIAKDDVPVVGTGPEDDRARHQHMTTFTVALGVNGTLEYKSEYKSAGTGDFADIRSGSKNWPLWPDPSMATWSASTSTFTDKSKWEDPRSIDDFWHTAVNGRGRYFSAGNPKAVVDGLTGALYGIQASLAAGSAVGVSSQEPVAGDNFAYVTSYKTVSWTGDMEAREINTDGTVAKTAYWHAQSKLQALTGSACDNRKIYLIRMGEIASANLVNFSWDTLACDSYGAPTGSADTGLNATEKLLFTSSTNAGALSQYSAMTDGTNSTVDQRTAAKGANLVNFIRGQRGKEGFEPGSLNKLYRTRDAVLGDIVSSQPVYVKEPFAEYLDEGYQSFRDEKLNRAPVVYVGANDGMLHAFNAAVFQSDGVTLDPDGGKELWAIIPSSVSAKLYTLADQYYKNTHTYFVDGSPVVGDVDMDAPAIPAPPAGRPAWTPNWKSILVGGLNAGGRAFYALDVTDPAAPKALWEFKLGSCGVSGEDCHIGYSFGRPVITKLADGRWVVILTSGYNNVRSPSGTGDGKGYFYVLKAYTGELLYKIETSAGDASTPSGLTQINSYIENARFDNTTKRVYGTDVLGNVWLADVNDNIEPSGREAHLLGTTKTAAGDLQPITVRPEIAEFGGKTWVFVGTGKLLGPSDLDSALATTTRRQSVYGFVDLVNFPDTDDPADPSDPLTMPIDNLHSALRPMEISYDTSNTRVSTTGACDSTNTPKRCRGDYGWVLDLPESGERVNIGMKVVSGTLVFGSNVPQGSVCNPSGFGFVNYVGASTGLAVDPAVSTIVSTKISDGMIVGINIVWSKPTTDGKGGGAITGFGKPQVVVTDSVGNQEKVDPSYSSPPLTGRRVSWRELTKP